MYKESEIKFSDFVGYDQFELNAYLSYLFHRFYDHDSNWSEKTRSQSSKDISVCLLK
ncbi:hypothetical protein [Niallia endozanthoxylica]|uniref:hypothetical protein n=1 Tax=Niallia endozanthoxylica TaxID=2036016 RepID=UPI00168A70D4|nr:hypothetical protein [Niallia endozanthoxylica]